MGPETWSSVGRVRSGPVASVRHCLGSRLFGFNPLSQFASSVWRRLICSVLLLVLLLGLTGVPLTRKVPAKEGRFPCENCPCGCVDADFCWDRCCCHSDADKLQWASENDVTPPAFLVARVTQSAQSARLAGTPSSRRSSCCSHCTTATPSPASKSPAETPQVHRLVMLESAAKCRGIELVWSLLSCVIINARPPMLTRPDPPFLYQLPIINDRSPSVSTSLDPPVP